MGEGSYPVMFFFIYEKVYEISFIRKVKNYIFFLILPFSTRITGTFPGLISLPPWHLPSPIPTSPLLPNHVKSFIFWIRNASQLEHSEYSNWQGFCKREVYKCTVSKILIFKGLWQNSPCASNILTLFPTGGHGKSV